jgi:hypothetical protein
MARALKRWAYGGGALTAALAVGGFLWSMPVVREGACALQMAQPGLAQSCCMAGFTEKALVRDAAFAPAPLEKTGYPRQSPAPFAAEADARADAIARLPADAAQLCAVADPDFERLAAATAEPARLDCRQTPAGWTCAADYRAHCAIEQRKLVERCPG